MTTTADAQKKRATKKRTRPAQEKRTASEVERANGGLTGMQVFALWVLLLTGDGKPLSQQKVKLDRAALKGLERARLITIEPGRQKKNPAHGAKFHVTDEGWAWANGQGLAAAFARTRSAAMLLEELLARLGKYMEIHGLALDHVLRPRTVEQAATEDASTRHETPDASAPRDAEPAALEEQIRAAYLRVTGGVLNEYVRLALLRAQLGDAPVEAVDTELRQMQRRGGAVLYPIGDPKQILPEDDAAALRVSGERRDLLCIER
ncbi:hypothetical protein WMF37_37305 [Sorangium sp. So ce291]|uniref:hypothetical protein n=1 Tax=Sorangium sp. So ce291 TaxID=3133294 RepID=UPI003F607C93